MNNFFLPTSRKVLSTFQTFCLVGVQVAQMLVHFAHFKLRPGKGLFWVGFGDVLCTYISPKGICDG